MKVLNYHIPITYNSKIQLEKINSTANLPQKEIEHIHLKDFGIEYSTK